MNRPAILPDYVTPADIAGHFGMSERAVRDKVRKIGAYAELGKRMVLFPEHVEAFTEAIQCPSRSTSAATFGISEAPLLGVQSDAVRKRLIGKSQKGSKQKSKPERGIVVSMDRARG